MSDTVTIPRDRWERVRGEAALLVDMQQAGQILGVDALLPGDLDDIPADTERHSVEAMIDELVVERGHFVFFTARPAYTAVDIWRDPDSVGKPSGGPLADVSRPDWRAALRAAYEQVVGQADGGERG